MAVVSVRSPGRRTGEARREIERLAAAGQVAVGVAHDLANVLLVVVAQARVLGADSRLPADARESARHMGEAADRAVAISRHLVAFGKGDVAVGTTLLDEVVEHAMDLAPALLASGIEVDVRLGAPGASVALAPVELQQVLLNLLLNARDALPGTGRVCVETDLRPAPDGAGRRDAEARLVVTDDGPGMSPEVLRRATDPGFSTRSGPGRGIGLASVRAITERAGGRLALESSPGCGARVTVSLPVVPAM